MIRDPNNPCLFCNAEQSGIAIENDLAYASYDSYPISNFHCLIIPKRHVKDYFELNNDELLACNDLIIKIKNVGKISVQSIMHCHIHLIPRREGDVENPQGGVRSVIPKKQHYKREN